MQLVWRKRKWSIEAADLSAWSTFHLQSDFICDSGYRDVRAQVYTLSTLVYDIASDKDIALEIGFYSLPHN